MMKSQIPNPTSQSPSQREWEHGVSLVEASIILAVISVLAAIMAPAVNGYLESGRQVRVREDAQVIASAIQTFMADNGESQFLRDAINSGTPTVPPTRPDSNRVDLLVGDGDIPPLSATLAAETFWTQAVNGADVDTLSNHLIENLPDETLTSRYRNPSDIFIAAPGGNNIDFARSSSSGFNAPYAWRGGYLRGPVDPDPWGNRYAVNVAFLDPSPTAAIGGITAGFAFAAYPRLDVFVLSAGADEEIDTPSAQDGAVPGDDDFIHVVSSHAK
jgi:type II secretory pathway pseudopilin PulG